MELVQETPRITAVFRSFLRESGKSFNYQEEYIHARKEAIAARQKKQAKKERESQLKNTISWDYFVKFTNSENAVLMRQEYNTFQRIVKNLLKVDLVSQEELGAYLYQVYHVMRGEETDEEKRLLLSRLFSACRKLKKGDENFARLLSVTEKLSRLRKTADDETQESEYEFSKEFGKKIEFKYAPYVDEMEFREEDKPQPKPASKPGTASSALASASAIPQSSEAVGHHWLHDACESFLLENKLSHMDAIEMTPMLRDLLCSGKETEGVLADVLELIGETHMDFARTLIQNRVGIVKARADELMQQERQYMDEVASNAFAVKSKKEMALDKKRQAELKKLRVQMGKFITQDDWIAEMGVDVEKLRQVKESALSAGPDMSIKEGVDRDSLAGLARGFMLPEGAKTKDTDWYKEILLPAKQHAKVNPTLVPVTVFEDYAQLAFKGVTHLNRIQSEVFESAYRSNNNMLICAPTGAGKTNIALMTVLREVGQNMSNGVLKKEDFKIVYVAPMKALAAEMTRSFGSKLAPLGIQVKELTGDMQLTRQEIEQTQMIITTPEKWDVMTRKSSDVALAQLVKLLIIDEVHLLNEDRGAVIESLVARTLRQVEQSQSMIRIVGLSATLPNYRDVALFLRVDPSVGLFHFGPEYRPVPLEMDFIGVKGRTIPQQKQQMTDMCYNKLLESVRQGNQCMVFVHSRKDTANTAQALIDMANELTGHSVFLPSPSVLQSPGYKQAGIEVSKSRSRELNQLFPYGFGIHHAGMLRQDRTLMEKLFMKGYVQVLVCTATLAWGVNLPAHTVIIKGTQVYDAEKGGFNDLSALDVLQIFGRAGRPQFDTSGEAIILTTSDKLTEYVQKLSNSVPIESKFIDRLADHLNAEIVLGTVATIRDAVTWLAYTYLYIRMLKNPLAYGCTYHDKELDPRFVLKRTEFITAAARRLDKCKMIRFDERSGNLAVTELGRIASHYYIQNETIEHFNEKLKSTISDAMVCNIVAQAGEFSNIILRDDEVAELQNLENESCHLPIKGLEPQHNKVNVLLQSYIDRVNIDSFSLISDMSYISQNAGRVFRALFEIARSQGWIDLASKLLGFSLMIEKRLWSDSHPLAQFDLNRNVLDKLQKKDLSIEAIREMTAAELGQMFSLNPQAGKSILQASLWFPLLEIEAALSPITRTVIKVSLTIRASFQWNDKYHQQSQPFWLWVEDENSELVHSEYFILTKKQKDEEVKVSFIIPIYADPFPKAYYLTATSDRWLNADTQILLDMKSIILPDQQPPHTQLLPLQPLPRNVLHNEEFEKIYTFTHFNRVQTQVFYPLYHTDSNILLGAPTGSGKTIVAELAMLRVFNSENAKDKKIVYIGPLKALVRERKKDWKKRFGEMMGKKVIELTGDVTPDIRALQEADLILTTPEKWDGISRNWQQRSYVKKVALMIIDEIHLLGEDRGPILEIIVSRMRYVSSQTEQPIRFVGLSTALANPEDLSDWLGIEPPLGLYNFHPSVRPVPIRIHLQGFAGKHYCPRMATMNKPAYSAIHTHSPNKPVLIFVSSRRQTRLTALDLITYSVADENPKQFLKMDEEELEYHCSQLEDTNLRHTLEFGIGLHHAGLKNEDRALMEKLFKECKIQVLISTSTLAWGVNLPAHLVIIKGTEYYDPKTRRYEDFPVTDVLQMMGRAGRPQYDTEGVAVVMVEQSKKSFYKKFIREPFPVESSLKDCLHDHFNAEICGGTISCKQEAVDFLTWTYLFHRLERNPTYYGVPDVSFESISRFLSDAVDETLKDLRFAHCLEFDEEDKTKIYPTTMGRIASYYYLHFKTAEHFTRHINADCGLKELLEVLCDCSEYDELPVRHNEDVYNKTLSEQVQWPVNQYTYDSPHSKTSLLFQAHFSHLKFWIPDYLTDLKSVLDQSIRILQAIIDVSADQGWLWTTLKTIELLQMVMQGQWSNTSSLCQLPFFGPKTVDLFNKKKIEYLPQLLTMNRESLKRTIEGIVPKEQVASFWKVIDILPVVNVSWNLSGASDGEADKKEEKKERKVFAPEEEVELTVTLYRTTPIPTEGAHTPKFPKRKEEGWYLILGDPSTGELYALKRVNCMKKHSTYKLNFDMPADGEHTFALYFMCDVYLGLDQQYEIPFTVKS